MCIECIESRFLYCYACEGFVQDMSRREITGEVRLDAAGNATDGKAVFTHMAGTCKECAAAAADRKEPEPKLFKAVFGGGQPARPVGRVMAYDEAGAREKIREQLSKPGRDWYLDQWQVAGEHVKEVK
jgi:hypothetical protein